MLLPVAGTLPAYSFSPASLRSAAASAASGAPGGVAGAASGLSESDLRMVSELKARDRVVRTHEMAHMAAGAGLVTRGASYTYQNGPDGQRYAVGGEVGIDTSPGRTPEETLLKAERIRAAALAPAEPSGQDRQVAAAAAKMASQARMEISSASAESAAGLVQKTYASVAEAPTEAGSQLDAYA